MWVLDTAAQVAVIVSPVVALAGVIVTAYGIRSERKRRSQPGPSGPDAPPADLGAQALSRIYIPPRSEWVPPAEHLPPGLPSEPMEASDIPTVRKLRRDGHTYWISGRGERGDHGVVGLIGITLIILAALLAAYGLALWPFN